MVVFVVALSVAITVGMIGYIASLFVRDHKIATRGRDIRALVEDVRHVATSDSGSVTVKYRLSWIEGGEARHVEGRETIPARRLPQVRKGSEVDIRYLDDDHLAFVFDA
ncbi:DUF3592 domain-containing protein [Streptomyces anulatus]|uniref:DUF3592 domain-containing protein n=1 Tax=Streptomyces anulatus TaxID=1892 RepID=UPI00370319E2